MNVSTFAAAALVAVLLLAAPATAQTDGLRIDEVRDDDYPIVEVTVTVPDGLNDVSLSEEPFTITENGGQPMAPYLGAAPETDEASPAPSVVLAIDTSGSMTNSIALARTAADNFVASLPEGSEVAVVTFGDDTNVLIDSTANLRAVRSAIRSIEIRGRPNTALNDGVRRAASLLRQQPGQASTVVLLSDGENTAGDSSEEDAVTELKRADAQLWAVMLPSSQQDPEALDRLASDGGRVLPARDAGALDSIYQGLASELSRQYVLRYESEADGPTDVTVALDYGTIHAERTQTVTIDGTTAGTPDTQPATAVDAGTFVVEVPLLGTSGAFALGLGALALASIVLWLLILLPRRTRPYERLILEHHHSATATARLSAVARWTTEATDRRLRRGDLGARLDRELERAGLDLRPGELVVTTGSMMLVVYAIGVVVAIPLLGLMLALLVPLSVRLWLGVRRDKRHAAFADQLTDVLQLVASSLRAGYGLMQAVDAVSRDAEEPASGEFHRIIVEHRLGRDLDLAMNNCAARMDNPDFSWVVQAISIHRDVGGDLAKVLDNIVATIRDRNAVHRQVRALSAEGRMSAWVLTGMPIGVLIVLQALSPEYMSSLLTEPVGWLLLSVAAVLMVIGVLVIRRMANIQY